MSVARHLGIKLAEYDQRIRTFIPYYGEILDAVAEALGPSRTRSPRVVDLGIGTGALAARCLAALPRGRILGIDSDPDMLETARRRLARHAGRIQLTRGNFLQTPIPRSDAIVASFALHHIRSTAAKERFYRACRAALAKNGLLVTGDVFLSDDPALVDRHFQRWRAHLERSYGARKAGKFLEMWAREDRYFPLTVELRLLERAGFRPEVVWRRAPFAVVIGRR
ncbi:MAG: class I SAM-dependent methyltransferase [Gemmatimonadetes bacterium]|nr:class I SAM-dependent methyltransferase [Gemmatimonadota bacterium]